MTKTEYLNRLAKRLKRLPKEDFAIAMAYFEEYFEEAGPEQEQQAIQDLGTPEEAADAIIRDLAYRQTSTEEKKDIRRGISTVWIVILAILASPVALPLAIVAVSLLFSLGTVIVSLFVSALLVAVAGVGGSVVVVFFGLYLCFLAPFDGLATLGLGLLGIGLCILLTYAMIWICRKLLFLLARAFRHFIKKGGTSHAKR